MGGKLMVGGELLSSFGLREWHNSTLPSYIVHQIKKLCIVHEIKVRQSVFIATTYIICRSRSPT